MLRQEELAFVKAISILQLSPAILVELRMALSRRKTKPVVPAGIRSTSASGARAPPTSAESTRGQAQSQRVNKLGRLVRARHRAPSTSRWVLASAHELIGSHGRTRCILQRAPRVPRGRGNERGCLGRVRRPSSAKWAAQAHSHGFRPV